MFSYPLVRDFYLRLGELGAVDYFVPAIVPRSFCNPVTVGSGRAGA